MRVRSLDADGDWTFGRGKSNYLQRNDAIAQSIQTRLLSFLGDCFFDITAGIDWFNLLGGKNRLAIELAISSTIINTEGVTSLIRLSLDVSETRRMTVSYEVNTVYTGITEPAQTVQSSSTFILTEGGSIITTEDGDPITIQ